MEQLEHEWDAAQFGVVWRACEQCVSDGAAGSERLYRLLAGFALAYLRLLLARDGAHDDGSAEQALAGLIAGLHPATAPPDASPERSPIAPSRERTAPSRYLFRREGDYWTIGSGAAVSRLRNLRGLGYIAELLRHPHRQIYVVDLIALAVPEQGRFSADDANVHGLRISAEMPNAPVLDRRARDDYRARWHELLAEEADAQRDNDVGRADRARREIAMLAEQLTVASSGSHGRGVPSFKERARVNARNCITAALRAVRPHDEVLWRHLSNSIKTGTFCCYGPDRPVIWEM